jgi:hypothetical protein
MPTTKVSAATCRPVRRILRMPRVVGRLGPTGLAYSAWKLWRRLPPKQRKRVLKQVRRHGPKLAAKAVKYAAKRRVRR